MGEERQPVSEADIPGDAIRKAIFPFDLYDKEGNKLDTGVARSQRFLRFSEKGPCVGFFQNGTRKIELLEEIGADLYRTGNFAFAKLQDLSFCSIPS